MFTGKWPIDQERIVYKLGTLSDLYQVEDMSPLTMLEEVTTVESRQDVAVTLVKIFLGQGLVVPFLDYLNMREVNKTSNLKEKGSFEEASYITNKLKGVMT
eukprot:g42899.t1